MWPSKRGEEDLGMGRVTAAPPMFASPGEWRRASTATTMRVMLRIHNSRPKPRKKLAQRARSSARKAPIQARSKHMVEMLMRATARILIREGYDALTTNRVAEEAGASVGSLYQYFPSKEAL